MQVIVRKKTTIRMSQDPINALEGDTETVKCNHDTDKELQDSLTIKWFKDGIELKKRMTEFYGTHKN